MDLMKQGLANQQASIDINNKILHLHLKFEYFDAIADGSKLKEYRDASKWQEKLDNDEYTSIRLYRGFEKVSLNTIIDLPYKGYTLETIKHPHFGDKPILVCCIDVEHKVVKYFVISECRICQKPVSISVNADSAKTTCSDEHAEELKEYDNG